MPSMKTRCGCTAVSCRRITGGADAARSLRYEEDLIELSRRLGLPLRIAHYPPYTSKRHPIEHRLFSQVERALHGVMLDSPQTALQVIQRVSTQPGVSVVARVLDLAYDIGGRKCSDSSRNIKHQFIRHDSVMGEWSHLVDGRSAVEMPDSATRYWIGAADATPDTEGRARPILGIDRSLRCSGTILLPARPGRSGGV
jgi:hypothetical protein